VRCMDERPGAVAPLPAAPADWELINVDGPGPFVTRAIYRLPDGAEVEWTSRRHRKGQGLRVVAVPTGGAPPTLERGTVPSRTWWIAALFAVGATCFLLGALPAYLDAVPARVDGLTFFVGSICFTAASYLSFVEVANSPDAIQRGRARRLPFKPAAWRPRSIDWWSTAIQLVGTVYFNVMTFLALYDDWSVSQEDRLVWRPDLIGSICFLVASYLAWAEVCHSLGRLKLRELAWWIVVLNLLGSIWFGVSAIGAYVSPDTEDVVSLRLDNGGTIAGALCFLVAAVLLIPEARATRAPTYSASP